MKFKLMDMLENTTNDETGVIFKIEYSFDGDFHTDITLHNGRTLKDKDLHDWEKVTDKEKAMSILKDCSEIYKNIASDLYINKYRN